MINYNIADLVSRINNNYIAANHLVDIPYTKENYEILTQLTKLGIINIIRDKNMSQKDSILSPPLSTTKFTNLRGPVGGREEKSEKVIGSIKKQEFIKIQLYPFSEAKISHRENSYSLFPPTFVEPSSAQRNPIVLNNSKGLLGTREQQKKEEKSNSNYPTGLRKEIESVNEKVERKISFYYPLNESQQKIKSKKILKVVSKPGKRVYISYKDIKDFNHGHKLYLLRTSKGIISSQTAIRYKIGGELLLKVSYSFN